MVPPPARIQKLTGRLRDLVPKASELWLDGAHNAHGAAALALSLSLHFLPFLPDLITQPAKPEAARPLQAELRSPPPVNQPSPPLKLPEPAKPVKKGEPEPTKKGEPAPAPKNPEPVKETKKGEPAPAVKAPAKSSKTVVKEEVVEVKKTPIRDFFRKLLNR